jgi:hypothetical protein
MQEIKLIRKYKDKILVCECFVENSVMFFSKRVRNANPTSRNRIRFASTVKNKLFVCGRGDRGQLGLGSGVTLQSFVKELDLNGFFHKLSVGYNHAMLAGKSKETILHCY